MVINLNFSFSEFSLLLFFLALFGLLLEDWVILRLVLLLEVGLIAVVGYTLSTDAVFAAGSVVFIVGILTVAAVESILLLSFIVVLHRLSATDNFIQTPLLQL